MTEAQDVDSPLIQANFDRVRQALASFDFIELAIVFGSVAKGAERPDSDLDIAIQGRLPLNVTQRIDLIDALAMALGRPVDLIDLKTAGQPVLNQIIKHGRRIIGKDEKMANLIFRNIMDQADFVPLQQRILKERREAWISK